MKLKILHLFLVTDKDIEESATQLRGYIGTAFKKYTELHHHLNSNGERQLLYEYPKIQYKISKNRAIILAIGEENISILRHVVFNLKNLKLKQNIYKILEINAHYDEPEFRITKKNESYTYEFHSPWIALNKKNYEKFNTYSLKKKRKLLEKILIGNILSVSKYLGYSVPAKINMEIEVYPMKIRFKSVDVIGFKGKFETNFLIPDYLGIGKGVSQGYGTIKKVDSALY